jgi:hypothetical protein
MQQRHWVPNHCVAVLPVDTPDVVVPINLQRSRLMRHRKIERENLERKCSLTRDVSTIKLEHSDEVNLRRKVLFFRQFILCSDI